MKFSSFSLWGAIVATASIVNAYDVVVVSLYGTGGVTKSVLVDNADAFRDICFEVFAAQNPDAVEYDSNGNIQGGADEYRQRKFDILSQFGNTAGAQRWQVQGGGGRKLEEETEQTWYEMGNLTNIQDELVYAKQFVHELYEETEESVKQLRRTQTQRKLTHGGCPGCRKREGVDSCHLLGCAGCCKGSTDAPLDADGSIFTTDHQFDVPNLQYELYKATSDLRSTITGTVGGKVYIIVERLSDYLLFTKKYTMESGESVKEKVHELALAAAGGSP